MESVEDGIRSNVKYFWTYIANRKSSSGIPSDMKYKDLSTNDPEEICNFFSDFFNSVYEQSSMGGASSSGDSERNSLISKIELSTNEIFRALNSLDSSKGPGPDGLPVTFLKATAKNICTPIHILFNKSLAQGIFPEVWKSANITPIYKSGSKQDVENYRPISIMSALPKLFERLVHDRVYPVLHHSIIQQQHGFVKKRSTTTNLVAFMDCLFNNMDSRVQVDAIYTDFRKAFDKVDHELLLNKISFNGIRGDLLRWFSSYVTNRTQRVVVNGFRSATTINVTSGVPQGSILGPLLFVLFINDIDTCFRNSKVLLYADDLKIYRPIKNLQDSRLLQEDLDRFSEYCSYNKLQLSLSKCCCISFTKNKNVIKPPYSLANTTLTRVSLIRDLGILLDDKLHLDAHINKVVNNAYRMYGFMMRSAKEFVRPSTYLYLYKSLIRSQLEYAVPVWNPFYNKYSERIEKVQRKFLKAMHYRCFRTVLYYKDLLKKYKLLDLKSRRTLLETVFLFDLCSNVYDCIDIRNKISYIVPRTTVCRGVRARPLFAVTSCRSNAGMRAPLRRLTNNYNKQFHHIDMFALSAGRFKNIISKTLSH